MSRYVVIGAGPIGSAVTRRLLADGALVTVVTRSGTEVPGAEAVALAAEDPALREITAGADGVVLATNPPYQRWVTQWPPILQNAIAAASGGRLVLIGNLYGYAPGTNPMTAAEPLRPATRKGALRTQLWQQLLAAHAAGTLQATEVRASDYIGPEALATDGAHAGRRFVDPVLAGRTAYVVGDPDAPHSWTAVADIAETVRAVFADDAAWGRPWVVPTDEPRSLRELAVEIARLGGRARAPRVRQMPRLLVQAAGLADPMMRELREVLYQHDRPFVSDGSETTALLGVEATGWPTLLAATVAAATELAPQR